MTVIIGVDLHNASNTIAMLDGDDVLVDHRYSNTASGFIEMLDTVTGWPQRRWAVEGAHGTGHLLAQQLTKSWLNLG